MHLGDEICDVRLSSRSSLDALHVVSGGADQKVRCRKLIEVLRQQLTLRILNETEKVIEEVSGDEQQSDDSDFGATSYH